MKPWRSLDPNTSDPGAFYFVPDPNGVQKHAVKRPRPPLVDDAFDAYTPQITSTPAKLPERGGGLSRPPPASSSSQGPLKNSSDTFFAATHTHRSEPVNSPASPHRSLEDHVAPQHRNGFPLARGNDLKGKARDDVREQYGEYQTYMQEMEKMFGKTGDLDLSLSRVHDDSGARETVNIGRVKSTRSNRSPAGGQTMMISRALGPSTVFRNPSLRSSDGKPPRPRQDYEEVSRRVIESTPDKTVTISTWREQVAQQANGNDFERMSIYYVNGGLDGEVLEHPHSEIGSLGEEQGFHDSISSAKREEPPQPTRSDNPDAFVERTPESQKIASNGHAAHQSPMRRQRSISRVTSMSDPQSQQDSSLSLSSSSSSGVHPSEQLPPTPPPKPKKAYAKTRPNMQSTPIDTRMQIPSFHPTRDGSIISTIRSSTPSPPSSSLSFERVLESCKPSLIHLVPTLAKLGITSKEHLRALASLNPETRDRELKEDALRCGITVMEWAILVDRLRSI